MRVTYLTTACGCKKLDDSYEQISVTLDPFFTFLNDHWFWYHDVATNPTRALAHHLPFQVNHIIHLDGRHALYVEEVPENLIIVSYLFLTPFIFPKESSICI